MYIIPINPNSQLMFLHDSDAPLTPRRTCTSRQQTVRLPAGWEPDVALDVVWYWLVQLDARARWATDEDDFAFEHDDQLVVVERSGTAATYRNGAAGLSVTTEIDGGEVTVEASKSLLASTWEQLLTRLREETDTQLGDFKLDG